MPDPKRERSENGVDERYKEFNEKNSKWHSEIEKSVKQVERAAKKTRRRVAS